MSMLERVGTDDANFNPLTRHFFVKGFVEERLAACVNVISGCKSVYRWEGKLVEEGEALIIIKTRVGLFGRLETRIGELHSYDVPEIIGVELAAVSDGYREFLAASLG